MKARLSPLWILCTSALVISPAYAANTLEMNGSFRQLSAGGVNYFMDSVGVGTTAATIGVEIAQNKALRVGNAYLSSGGDNAILANNEWYNGSAWTSSAAGAMYLIQGQAHYWYTHTAAGANTNIMSLNASGSLTVAGTVTVSGSYIYGSAQHLLINGVTWASNWYWSGQGGQPSWLWGSTDAVNMYVWNPANFSVNYATSAGYASNVSYASSVYSSTYCNYAYGGAWGGGGGGGDGGGGSCFIAGTQVLMADGSWKAIEKVAAGEFVMGLNGANEVLDTFHTHLGPYRSMWRLDNTLSFSGEHPMWIRLADGSETFGTHDYTQYLYEQRHHTYTVKGVPQKYMGLERTQIYAITEAQDFAHVTGWKHGRAVMDRSYTNETPLFNLIIGGSHTFIANGFVVSGEVHDDDIDYGTVKWNGLAFDAPQSVAA